MKAKWTAVLATLPVVALAGKKDRSSSDQAAANASDIPVLASLLERAQWTPTPELSGVFQAGHIFEETDMGHRPLATTCVEAVPTESPYTAVDVIASMQAGVHVKGLAARGSVTGEVVKKIKFGTPLQVSIPALQLQITDECAAKLNALPDARIKHSYVIQEVLQALITEQTCGRIDASGRIVGLGAAETEIQQACSQTSLDPVAVGYRTVPLKSLLQKDGDRTFAVLSGGGTSGGGSASASASSGFGDLGTDLGLEEKIREQNCMTAAAEAAAAVRDGKLGEAARAAQLDASQAWSRLSPQLNDCLRLDGDARGKCVAATKQWIDLANALTVSVAVSEESVETACGTRTVAVEGAKMRVEVPELRHAHAVLNQLQTVSASGGRSAANGLVKVPRGRYVVGSPSTEPGREDDEPRLEINQQYAFWISDHEVTRAEWETVMGEAPKAARLHGEKVDGDAYPVQDVSWCKALEYLNKRSIREGLDPAYTGVDDCVSEFDPKSVQWNTSANGYRLPTEVEWEVAARAGSTAPWPGADLREDLCLLGNLFDQSAEEAWDDLGTPVECDDGFVGLAPIRQFRPNAWGLYDTIGNVREWVWDGYQKKGMLTGRQSVEQYDSKRVHRGGSCASSAASARLAARDKLTAYKGHADLGFRVARNAE